ncbi:MAG TPA: hypothetical protein VI874_01040 [Candidatus Norongarragalinales archaeon]|nr:hypothetical protein [Candidatus Norongarragalinales archaeon]
MKKTFLLLLLSSLALATTVNEKGIFLGKEDLVKFECTSAKGKTVTLMGKTKWQTCKA